MALDLRLTDVQSPLLTVEPFSDCSASSAPAAPETSQVHLQGLRKEYQDTVAVDELTLEVARGAFVSLLGPSGCGKTTTLRMVAGLIRPTAGRVHIGGRDVTDLPPRRRRLAMVFQQFALFPHMTVADNVGFGLRMLKLDRKERQRRVGSALELVRMGELTRRYPKHLSGGQQQRVALARAIVVEPEVLLLDEPLSNLDAKLRQTMRDELVLLHRRLDMTSLYVTHDQEEALVMSDLIAVMNEGRIAQLGTPRELYETPASPFVADFIGRTNLLQAVVAESTGDGSLLRLPDGQVLHSDRPQSAPAGSTVDVSIRPERISVIRGQESRPGLVNALTAEIETRSYAGPITRYRVRLRNTESIVMVETPPDRSAASVDEGEEVTLEIASEDVVVFAPRSGSG